MRSVPVVPGAATTKATATNPRIDVASSMKSSVPAQMVSQINSATGIAQMRTSIPVTNFNARQTPPISEAMTNRLTKICRRRARSRPGRSRW